MPPSRNYGLHTGLDRLWPFAFPRDFDWPGVHCGVKRDPQKQDLTLVVSDEPAVAAGVYTQNLVFAAPVALDRGRTPSDRIRAVVDQLGHCQRLHGRARRCATPSEMAALAAAACGAEAEQALVLSTGVIGEFLPMDKIDAGHSRRGRASSAHDEASLIAAARGMMTTDTVHKLAGRTVDDRRPRRSRSPAWPRARR